MSNHQDALDLARDLAGNDNLYSVQPFIKIAGDTLLGLFLERVVYWSDKSGNERLKQLRIFYKSAEEWEEELGLSYSQVTRARKELEKMGFIKTSKHKVNDAPTIHYYANMDAIKEAIIQYYSGYANLDNSEIQESSISENDKVEIEETQETIEIQESEVSSYNSSNPNNNSTSRGRGRNLKSVDCSDSPDPNFAEICMLWQSNIGFLSPLIADEIKGVLVEVPPEFQVEWFREAISRACAANARKWNYIKAILANWIAAGGIDLQSRDEAESHSPLPPSPDLPPPEPLPPYALQWQRAGSVLAGGIVTRATYEQIIKQCEARPGKNGTFVIAVPENLCQQIHRLEKPILQALNQFTKADHLEVITI
jgi:DnaD/phage-associated family protein